MCARATCTSRHLRDVAFVLTHVMTILVACALGLSPLLPTHVGMDTPSIQHAVRG
jgi:hypothetical protein